MKHITPEITASLVLAFLNLNVEGIEPMCLFYFAIAVWLRLVWNSAILIHGLGHVATIFAIDRASSQIKDILENRTIGEILFSLVPGSPIFIPGLERDRYPHVAVGDITPWKVRLKATGGIGLNLFAAIIAFQICSYSSSVPNVILGQTFAIANLLIAFSSRTDIYAIGTGIADNFYCGNFGFICKRDDTDGNQLLSERMTNMYYQMGRETEIRGEQAGGGLVVAKDQSQQTVFVGEKVVNRKRDNLTKSLETAFGSVRSKSQRQGISPWELSTELPTMAVWHYRFGTSGPPAIRETHWHEWMDARQERVWEFTEGQWVCQNKNVNHRITHNGDFDAWKIYNEPVENGELGLWLERVLHTSNEARGDSPKIAGMMDLLITQGMWYASVRLAYHLVVADSIHSVFDGQLPRPDAPNTAPSTLELGNWAKMFEDTFKLYRELLAAPNSPVCNHYSPRLEKHILQVVAQDDSIKQWSEEKRVKFVETAVSAFFRNDAYVATKTFMARAVGSFGLVTVTTLDRERLVLSALGQPMSIGFNGQEGYMVYASEPAAVDAVLLNLPQSYRLDLDQSGGEIALVSSNEIEMIYSMSEEEELNPTELSGRWISMEDHPYLPHVKYPNKNTKDPIASDSQEIPAILEEIKLNWQNPESFNCYTASYLARLLCEKARRYNLQQQDLLTKSQSDRHLAAVDLLLVGVENSFWLGERFARDLKTIFPGLHVKNSSANQVLQDLNSDSSNLQLDKDSIVLAITQSGQTFPTVQVINTFDRLYCRGEIGELFILTGELSSFLGSPVIKHKQFGFSSEYRKIFVNGSGRRTAEPATVAVAAAHQTFTELLLYLAKEVRITFPDSKPFGMILSFKSITVLDNMKDDFVDISSVQIMGATPTGKKIDSAIREELIKNGRKWAWHITETPTAWAIHALYVLVTVAWAIPLAKTLLNIAVGLLPISPDLFIFRLINPVVTLVDIGIYIFGTWLWTLILRYFQGREPLARTGKRTLVIGDVVWVYQLLENYVSKLFSLSYGIASLEVHGANPEDDLLHDFGHRVVRGTLLFLNVPDGRKSEKLKQKESAVIMAGKQADGVRNVNVGPEVVVIGSNPEIARKGFTKAIVLDENNEHFHHQDDSVYFQSNISQHQKAIIEELRESRFNAFERLLASYVFFWAMAKKVASFPLLNYEYWKSQSRTKIMTTAAPISRISTPVVSDKKSDRLPPDLTSVVLSDKQNYRNNRSNINTENN